VHLEEEADLEEGVGADGEDLVAIEVEDEVDVVEVVVVRRLSLLLPPHNHL
jgi:hypothetical protein